MVTLLPLATNTTSRLAKPAFGTDSIMFMAKIGAVVLPVITGKPACWKSWLLVSVAIAEYVR